MTCSGGRIAKHQLWDKGQLLIIDRANSDERISEQEQRNKRRDRNRMIWLWRDARKSHAMGRLNFAARRRKTATENFCRTPRREQCPGPACRRLLPFEFRDNCFQATSAVTYLPLIECRVAQHQSATSDRLQAESRERERDEVVTPGGARDCPIINAARQPSDQMHSGLTLFNLQQTGKFGLRCGDEISLSFRV